MEDSKDITEKDCGLTIGELWELMDDISIRNISFDDSGVHLENVLEMIERYKRN